jgi:hypothetical protein
MPLSRGAYLAQEFTIEVIGRQIQLLLAQLPKPLLLPKTPDAATLAVEIAFACMKFGFYRDNCISAQARQQACIAAVAYLSNWSDAL